MKKEYIGNIKKTKAHGIKRLINSFKYSIEGLKYAYVNEQSLTLHIFGAILVLSLGFILRINGIEWLFILLYIGIIMAVELINTAIEATIDLFTKDYHELAKIAKDTASAAVFVFTMVSFVGTIIIFAPKIINSIF